MKKGQPMHDYFTRPGPVSLYVHIPFCLRRCRYCDFSSSVSGEETMARYVDCLLKEMALWSPRLQGRPVTTIFFGGGTPGLLPISLMRRITEGLRENFDLSQVTEWTLESNPEITDREKCAAWLAMGFDRLSLGFQAAQPQLLAMLGRRAAPEDFLRAVSAAREAGFTRISADLMASLPGQSTGDLTGSIDLAVSAGVDHISLYSLVVHEETPLGADILAGLLSQPDEDADRDAFAAACDHLAVLGYDRYEISNFARPGQESRHNLVYWQRGDYLGLGAAAASCDGTHRFTNRFDMDDYCRALEAGESTIDEQETLTREDEAFETLMLGLRLTEGVSRAAFAEKFGYDFALRHASIFERWCSAGFAVLTPDHLRLTPSGLDVQNALLVEIME